MTPAASEPSDETLMASLARDQGAALDALMLRWQLPLRSFLCRHTQNEADALDLAQETFVRIYVHRARYREGARFSTWMFQIALNLARDHARRRFRRPTEELTELIAPADPAANPKAALLNAERASAVRSALAALPEKLRVPLLLSEYENKSHQEIADIVESTPKAVETRVARARARLRETLARFLN